MNNSPTHVILLLVAAFAPGELPVSGATKPLNPEQEKPMRLYMESYTYVEHAEVHPSGSDAVPTYSFAENGVYTWQTVWVDGQGGSASCNWSRDWDTTGTIGDTSGWSTMDETYQWPSSDWPNFVEGTTTGNSTYVYQEGETNSHSWSDPAAPLSVAQSGSEGDFLVVGFEHCTVSDSAEDTRTWDEGGSSRQAQDNVVYSRTAETVMKLFTGGKKQSGRRNLFMLSCTARRSTEIKLNPNLLDDLDYWELFLPPEWGSMADVPPSQISIDGMSLGNDGKRYCSYADGLTRDVTPRIKNADFYTFDLPQPSKHKLLIKANNEILSADSPNKEFCVGQKVTFTNEWDFTPLGISSNSYDWVMSTKYVNHSWQHYWVDEFGDTNHYGSVNYDRDVEVLKLASPWAWWVSGGIKNVGLNLTVLFDNGQSAKIKAKGKFGMHRPTATMMPFTTGEFYRQFFTTSYTLACKLKYGTDDQNAYGQMQYRVKILTDCDGDAGITQICDLDYSNPASQCTGNLDGNDEFYHGTQGIMQQANHYTYGNNVPFFDTPYNIWTSPNRLKGQFRDYVRFRPNGVASIFVTLGIVTWEMHAVAERVEFSGVWELTTDSHPAPVGPDTSDEFPVWTEVHED